jgi:hypothetical protein
MVSVREALAGIHEFHRLCEKRERTGGLTMAEANVLYWLRDQFEPRRESDCGVWREVVQFEGRCLGTMRSDGADCAIEIIRASLRELEIASSAALCRGQSVRLIVKAYGEVLRFRGRAIDVDPETNRAAIMLAAPTVAQQHAARCARIVPAADRVTSERVEISERRRSALRWAAAAAAVIALSAAAAHFLESAGASPVRPSAVADSAEPATMQPLPPTREAIRDLEEPAFVR